jgi:hypothetical protein
LGTDETIGFNQLFLWDKMRMYHLVINGWLENPYQWRFRKFIELNGGGFSSATFDYWRANRLSLGGAFVNRIVSDPTRQEEFRTLPLKAHQPSFRGLTISQVSTLVHILYLQVHIPFGCSYLCMFKGSYSRFV